MKKQSLSELTMDIWSPLQSQATEPVKGNQFQNNGGSPGDDENETGNDVEG